MKYFHFPDKIIFLVLLCGIELPGVYGQGSISANVPFPLVQSSLGKETKLSCSVPPNDVSRTKVRFCVWERINQDKNAPTFILNFNEITSQPGLYSGMPGYSYTGEGFRDGDCGIKIASVKQEDISKWHCTLITDDKVYRGYLELEKLEPPTTPTTTPAPRQINSSGVAIASSRISLDLTDEDKDSQRFSQDNRPRPIITSYNDARAIVQPEIIVHSTSSNGSPQLIQEVKVESAGLQIKPRRGKLIVFE